MKQFKQDKKHNFRVFLMYDRFGEPYWEITDFKNSYIKEKISFRIPFDYVIKKAIELYEQEEHEYLPF